MCRAQMFTTIIDVVFGAFHAESIFMVTIVAHLVCMLVPSGYNCYGQILTSCGHAFNVGIFACGYYAVYIDDPYVDDSGVMLTVVASFALVAGGVVGMLVPSNLTEYVQCVTWGSVFVIGFFLIVFRE